MATEATTYATREPDGSYTLRQTRFISQKNHPHDICALARSASELRSMCEPFFTDADYSQIETQPTEPPTANT